MPVGAIASKQVDAPRTCSVGLQNDLRVVRQRTVQREDHRADIERIDVAHEGPTAEWARGWQRRDRKNEPSSDKIVAVSKKSRQNARPASDRAPDQIPRPPAPTPRGPSELTAAPSRRHGSGRPRPCQPASSWRNRRTEPGSTRRSVSQHDLASSGRGPSSARITLPTSSGSTPSMRDQRRNGLVAGRSETGRTMAKASGTVSRSPRRRRGCSLPVGGCW